MVHSPGSGMVHSPGSGMVHSPGSGFKMRIFAFQFIYIIVPNHTVLVPLCYAPHALNHFFTINSEPSILQYPVAITTE